VWSQAPQIDLKLQQVNQRVEVNKWFWICRSLLPGRWFQFGFLIGAVDVVLDRFMKAIRYLRRQLCGDNEIHFLHNLWAVAF